MRTVHFISGLPRSGSTLLCNLLGQNPRFAVAGTSGLVDMLLCVRNGWDRLKEFQAMPAVESEAKKASVLRGMFLGYFRSGGPEVVFDKSRTWLAHLEMVEEILGRKVKVLVPVRDVRDVLASFEALWRKSAATRQIPYEAAHYHQFQTCPGRCAFWMAPDGPVGIAYARVLDAVHRGFRDRLHFVPYERLCRDPWQTLANIYSFLEEGSLYGHDFENVEQLTQEDDFAYGFPGLHEVRSKVEPSEPRWPSLLGAVAAQYEPLNFTLGYPERKDS
jgi:sulfotransferase